MIILRQKEFGRFGSFMKNIFRRNKPIDLLGEPSMKNIRTNLPASPKTVKMNSRQKRRFVSDNNLDAVMNRGIPQSKFSQPEAKRIIINNPTQGIISTPSSGKTVNFLDARNIITSSKPSTSSTIPPSVMSKSSRRSMRGTGSGKGNRGRKQGRSGKKRNRNTTTLDSVMSKPKNPVVNQNNNVVNSTKSVVKNISNSTNTNVPNFSNSIISYPSSPNNFVSSSTKTVIKPKAQPTYFNGQQSFIGPNKNVPVSNSTVYNIPSKPKAQQPTYFNGQQSFIGPNKNVPASNSTVYNIPSKPKAQPNTSSSTMSIENKNITDKKGKGIGWIGATGIGLGGAALGVGLGYEMNNKKKKDNNN